MKAVMPEVPESILKWRRQTGADRWDEMWQGVLHMPPSPNDAHQDLEWELETWLRRQWGRTHGGKVFHQRNVARPGDWPHDYRIPDIVLLSADRFGIECHDYLDGAPDVVVEIESPHDETREKLAFYASIGVPEVWIVDRDTKAPEMLALGAGAYVTLPPAGDGWIASAATRVELRAEPGDRLGIRLAGEASTHRVLPEV